MPARVWGYWTRGKLDILKRYLDAFTTTTKNRASERIYIDAFAGEPENRDRLTNEPIKGSATIALDIDNPPFTHLLFFENKSNALRLKKHLTNRYPRRDFEVIGGDCNKLIPLELEKIRRLNWAPTFAFVDPDGMEAEWRTLKALSEFKKDGLSKTELFVLFAAPMFVRLLPCDGSEVRESNIDKINRMYGTEDWRNIYEARLSADLTPAQARGEYLNLMRWRLERILGYKWTLPIAVKNEGGGTIYYMIFATDHEAGDRIMRNVYAHAAVEFPKMRAEARSLRNQLENEGRGQDALFEWREELLAPVKEDERFYLHDPPSQPWL